MGELKEERIQCIRGFMNINIGQCYNAIKVSSTIDHGYKGSMVTEPCQSALTFCERSLKYSNHGH